MLDPNEEEQNANANHLQEQKSEQEQKPTPTPTPTPTPETPVIKPEVISGKQEQEYVPPYMKEYDKNEKYYY